MGRVAIGSSAGEPDCPKAAGIPSRINPAPIPKAPCNSRRREGFPLPISSPDSEPIRTHLLLGEAPTPGDIAALTNARQCGSAHAHVPAKKKLPGTQSGGHFHRFYVDLPGLPSAGQGSPYAQKVVFAG